MVGSSRAEAISSDDSVSSTEAKELPPMQGEVPRRDLEAGKLNGATQKTVVAAAMGHLDRAERTGLVDQLMGATGQDQEPLLQGIKDRLQRAGLQPPSIRVQYTNLTVHAKIFVGARATPTVFNAYRNAAEAVLQGLHLRKNDKRNFVILSNISGTLVPSRFTLLLGPPGSGKSTLLKALSNQLRRTGVEVTGGVTYNGRSFGDFVPERTAAYVEQADMHIAQLTVRDTLDFAARCQGSGHYPSQLEELLLKEKQDGIEPNLAVDAFMRARALQGQPHSIVTDQMLRVLGLGVCGDTMIGDDMTRGISGGQKKRVTAGEALVGPYSALFLDEISTGLDSSTTFLVVKAMRDFAHNYNATVLMALLQPDPETFDLFDDIMLLSEGRLVYHGPKEEVLPFFWRMGFSLPGRVAIADFLQEVTSKSDQHHYWAKDDEEYEYISVLEMAQTFQEEAAEGVISSPAALGPIFNGDASSLGTTQNSEEPASSSGLGDLETKTYALSGWESFKACSRREALLIESMKGVYITRVVQAGVVAAVVGTLLLRTQVHPGTLDGGLLYLGALFLSILYIQFSTLMELTFTVDRLPIFFRQRARRFYPTWAFHLPPTLMHMPFSVAEAITWSCVVYFTIGFAPEVGRFFMYTLIITLQHYMAVSMFRMAGAIAQNMITAYTAGAFLMLICFLLGGFLIAKPDLHAYIRWAYWINPLAYSTRAMFINEFSSPRWGADFPIAALIFPGEGPMSLGHFILHQWGFPSEYWWVWVCVGAMVACTAVFNLAGYLAHAYLPQWRYSGTIVSEEALLEREAEDPNRLPYTSPASSFKGAKSLVGSKRRVFDTALEHVSAKSGVFTSGEKNLRSPTLTSSTSTTTSPMKVICTEEASSASSSRPSSPQQNPPLTPTLARQNSTPCPFSGIDVPETQSLGLEHVDTSVLYGAASLNGGPSLIEIPEILRTRGSGLSSAASGHYHDAIDERSLPVSPFNDTASASGMDPTAGSPEFGSRRRDYADAMAADGVGRSRSRRSFGRDEGQTVESAVHGAASVPGSTRSLAGGGAASLQASPLRARGGSLDRWASFERRRSFQEDRRTTDQVDAAMVQKLSAQLSRLSNISVDAVSPMQHGVQRGMVLPFDAMTLTFQDVRYCVPLQSRQAKNEAKARGTRPVLELLRGVEGAFRPGVLTALMGVTGAGKTTLMDVLAGRKTTGTITGDIRVNGHPWARDSFVRVSGYVEQFDVHSPQATVREALLFSARLRASGFIDRATLDVFVDEVIELVELGPLRDALVGGSGEGNGLSVEQRKRVSVAVELVANPAIVFMDEPTTGLDARAAAIVMRAVRNIVDTGRTIVCTIHQPSIQIFEAFDELLLLKQGGQQIFSGQTGLHSGKLVKYFSRVPGVIPLRDGQNPASWVLEVTSAAEEERVGVDFAEIYNRSPLHARTAELIQRLGVPATDSKPLEFTRQYAQPLYSQFWLLLQKHWRTYWRWPSYNGTRYLLTLGIGVLFTIIFWGLGKNRETIKDVLNVQGSLYMVTLFMGVLNSMMVQPVMVAERHVFWRERAAGLYAVLPWSAAQFVVEFVYNVIQGLFYSCLVYFSIGFGYDARKFAWFTIYMTLTLLYFTYVGIMTVTLTPNLILATLNASGLYALFNLFAGFIMPKPQMPVWWSWYYYANPLAWGVWGLMDSQLGDDVEHWILAPPPVSSYIPVSKLLRVYFGYQKNYLGAIVGILCGFTAFFWFISVVCLKFLNFQRR